VPGSEKSPVSGSDAPILIGPSAAGGASVGGASVAAGTSVAAGASVAGGGACVVAAPPQAVIRRLAATMLIISFHSLDFILFSSLALRRYKIQKLSDQAQDGSLIITSFQVEQVSDLFQIIATTD
jgi:hypothetical protein